MRRHLVVETFSNIDVNELNRLGAFKDRDWEWVMNFPYQGLKTSRRLVEYRGHEPDWPVDRPSQRIPIQWTRCTFGGARPWFTCTCGRRVGKLYHYLGCLGCRLCGELIYASQRRGPKARLHRKAVRIRNLFGDEGRPGVDAFPPRRWRMQHRTYARLRGEAALIERKLLADGLYRPRPRRLRRPYDRRA